MIDDGGDHPARAAPRGPAVEEDGFVGLQYGRCEGGIGDGEGIAAGTRGRRRWKFLSALAADGL